MDRRASLSLAAATVRAGDSVDVVGEGGSGRSTFLKDLMAALRTEGWNVVVIQGIAALKHLPLAALALPGVLENAVEPRGASSLSLMSADLRAMVSTAPSVIVVDDWDDLDPTSWGVVDAIRRAEAVPVVITRPRGRRMNLERSEPEWPPVPPAYLIELPPWRIDELREALSVELDAPIDQDTLSHIHAMAGGRIGLALALVRSAVRTGRLSQDSYGVWTSTDDL